jgi:hypothetical protein
MKPRKGPFLDHLDIYERTPERSSRQARMKGNSISFYLLSHICLAIIPFDRAPTSFPSSHHDRSTAGVEEIRDFAPHLLRRHIGRRGREQHHQHQKLEQCRHSSRKIGFPHKPSHEIIRNPTPDRKYVSTSFPNADELEEVPLSPKSRPKVS